MWDYLDTVGVLEKGTDEEIKKAKRQYRKKYFLEYKRKQRFTKPEYTVVLSKSKGEYERIVLAAKRHKRTVSAFPKDNRIRFVTCLWMRCVAANLTFAGLPGHLMCLLTPD